MRRSWKGSRDSIFLLMSVLIELSSPSLPAFGSEYLYFDKSTIFSHTLLLLATHKMEVSGFDAILLHCGTIIILIPTVAWLVQCLLNLASVFDLGVDSPRGDVSSIHMEFEEEQVIRRGRITLDDIADPKLCTLQNERQRITTEQEDKADTNLVQKVYTPTPLS